MRYTRLFFYSPSQVRLIGGFPFLDGEPGDQKPARGAKNTRPRVL